jgi:demethylsterigmatocystin 6-O-methyltransferase
MAPDSILLVDEMVVPKTKASKISTQVDLTMLSNFASEERSEPRWHGLLGDAGFKIEEIYTYQKEVGDAVIVASVK